MIPNTQSDIQIDPTQHQQLLDFLRSESALANNQHSSVSLTIAKHLFSKESHRNKNIVLSPLSLQVVLSIIAAGSDGSTQQQLLDFLQSNSTDQLNSFASKLVSVILKDGAPAGGPRLSFVDGVWVEKTLSLQPSFKQIVSNDYKANLSSVDFKNKICFYICSLFTTKFKCINFVFGQRSEFMGCKKTNGIIKQLLPSRSVNSLTRLIIANALYFKGVWNDKFDASKTKDYDFHLLNGSSIKVPFMTSKEEQYIRAFDDFKVLGLPYKQGEDKREFTMYFFLPNAKDGLPTLLEKLASESESLKHKLPYDRVEVGDFRIPRFNISFGLETSDMLKELGVVLPFTNGGLTKMVNSSQNLCISKIFHKSFIDVNEEGTEAVAATATEVFTSSGMGFPTRLDFVAGHPFLFMIREELTGTIIFVGQVFNPLAG
ncbi:serpin-ZX-like protein [Medicago truncatula]|uniref:Serpin-ZX-like protein n=1 Tax=Medicago truncatula TaxID=3880 RepID=G7J5R0_MEDTR|nr:serpin-ZX-like protein [Medicago truncatula]